MATKNQVEVGININDMGTADKAIKNAERLKAAYESASASASKLGGTAGSRAAAEMSNQQYGQARGTTGQTGASARDFANQAQGLGGLVRLYATYAANVFAVGAAFRALSSAMDTTNMIRGLDALGSRSGQSLGTLSKRISDLTDGAVSLREAMEVTAKGSAAGLSSEQMERLAKVAKSSSIALGVSMPDALSRLSRGISKLEPELLDELGIFTKIGPAVTKYAASLGRAESSLTDFERRQAFANAVLEEGEKKFAAINEELQANSYDKLAAALKNVAYEGLNLVNKVLGPIVEFLSQTPVALIGVLGLLGGKILKQAGATLSQFKDQYLQAAKTIKEQNELRIADLNSFSEKASKILANQANLTADASLEAFEKKEAEYKKLIDRTSKKFASTNLTKLFDPNLAIGDIDEQQWAKAEERLKKLQSMKKLNDAQSRELAAGTALFEAKAAEEAASKIKNANKDKFDELLKQSNAYKNVQAAIHKAEIKQTQDEIAGNFVKARSLFGIRNAWSIMQAEIALAGNKIDLASRSMIYFKAATGLATEAVAFLGRALNKAFLIIGIAVTAFEILSSIFSKNAKESAAFSSSVDTAEESVKNAERTVKSYIKSLGYLNQSSIETAKAIDNAFGEISNSTKKMLSDFEETLKTQGTFDRAVDYLWKVIGKSSYDKVGRTLASQINSALDLAARSGMGEELKAKLANILILNESDLNNSEKVITRITKLAEIAPDKLQEVSAAMNEIKKRTAETAGAFDQLKQATDAYIKLQQEFYQSTESKDPLFKLAGGLLKVSEALTNTFNQGINGISAFYKLVGQSPDILGAFSEDTRSKIISNYSTIIQLTEDLGKKQERLRSVQKGLSEISAPGGSKDLNDWTTKYLSLQKEQSKLNKEISIVQKLMSQSQADAVNFISEIAAKAQDLIKKAVNNAKELNVIKFDKQLAQLLTGVNKVELEYSANKRELDIKIKEIDINLQQIDSTIALTDAIKELNLTESIRLEKEKNPQGSELLTNLTLQKTINDQVANVLKQIAENPNQRENILAGVSPQARQILEQRELLKQQRESAQLAAREALEGDKKVQRLKYETDLVKAQVEDYNRKLAIETSTANITISNLENSKRLNEISEEEYINKKLTAEQTLLELNYTKEINSLIQSRQSLLAQASKLPEGENRNRLIQEAAKLQADIDDRAAKRAADVAKLQTDAAKLRLDLAFKINLAELKNRQELDNLEQSRKEFETTRYSEIVKQQESILDFARERGLITEQQYIQQKLANDLSIASEEHRNKLASIKLATEQKIAELQLQLASNTKTEEERKILKNQINTAQLVGNENKRQEEELYKLKVNNITQTAQIQYEKSFDALYNAITEALIKGGDEGGKIFRKAITDELKKPFNIIVRALIKPIVDIVSSLTAKASEKLLGAFGLGDVGKLLGLGGSSPNVKTAGSSSGGMDLLSLIGAPFAALGAGVKAITSGIKGLTDTVSKSSTTIDKALDKVDSQATVTADSLGELGINTDLIAKNTSSPAFNLDYVDAATTAATKATEASSGTFANLFKNLFSGSGGKNIFSSFFDKIIESPIGKKLGLSKEGETFNMDYADQGVAKQQGSVDKTQAGSTFGGVGSAISSALTGYMLGNMISGKFSVIGDKPETATAVGTAIGLAVAGPIGAIVGGIVGGLANRAFGRGPKELQSTGIRGTFSASMGANVEQFAAFKQKGGWFRSDKYSEDVTKISEGLQNLFDQSIKATTRSVKKYAEALGLGTSTIDSFSKEIFIDLKDLTGDQISQAIAEGIKNWSDELIKATYPELEKFRLMGDTLSDTLSKLGGNLLTVNNVFSDLGKNLFETSISGGILASNLIDIFEGLDKFTQQLDFYYQNFYSEEERLLTTTNKVVDAMADLGLSSIDTKEEFRQLIDGLDLTKESNQLLLKSLMDIAPAFNEVYTSISKSIESLKQDIQSYEEELIKWKVKELEYYKKNIEAIKKTQEAELDRINDQIDSYGKLISLRDEEISKIQEQINPLQRTVDGLKGFLDTIKKYRTSLLMGSESILTPGQKYTASKSELQSVIQNLTSSDETTRQKAESDLQSVSSQFLQASRDFYASSSQYTTDFNFVMSLLDSLETSTTTQLSTDELALQELKNQVTALNQANDLDRESIRYQENLQQQTQQIINDLDRQLEYYDRQIDELTTVNYTLTEIRDNIILYTERILSAQTSLAQREASIGTVDSSATSNLVSGFNSAAGSELSISDRFASTNTAITNANTAITTANVSDSSNVSGLSAQQLANIKAGGVYVDNGLSGDGYEQRWIPVDEQGNPTYNPFSSAIDISSSGWATGTNYVPQDMRGTVHEGERIVPKADNAKLFQMIEGYQAGSNTNQEMVQEIRKLNQKIESLERTIAEGDIMNAQATDRNTLEVSRSITNSSTDKQYMESIRRRTQI